MKNLWLPRKTDRGGQVGLGVWDGNGVKLCCDDHCTTTSIIKFIELKKNEHRALNAQRTKAGDTVWKEERGVGEVGIGQMEV